MDGIDFRFRPPDRLHVWQSLALTMSQAAALTGVSERQIQHWLDKGYVRPTGPDERKLNGPALDMVMLIRQARGAGVPLRRAAVLAQEYLDGQSGDTLHTDVSRWAREDLVLRLAEARQAIETLESSLRDPSAGDGRSRVLDLSTLSADGVSSQRP